MEILIKVVISAVVVILVYYEVVFLRGVWRSQIDPVATVARVVETLKPNTEIIATRDPDKIYQDGKPVGDVSGTVTEEGQRITFQRLLNTTGLKTDRAFEFRRLRLRIISIGTTTGSYSSMEITPTGPRTVTGTDVLGTVVCERVGT